MPGYWMTNSLTGSLRRHRYKAVVHCILPTDPLSSEMENYTGTNVTYTNVKTATTEKVTASCAVKMR